MGTFIAILVVLFLLGYVGGLISELFKRLGELPGTQVFAKIVIIGILLLAVFSWGAPWWCLIPAGLVAFA